MDLLTLPMDKRLLLCVYIFLAENFNLNEKNKENSSEKFNSMSWRFKQYFGYIFIYKYLF
jgi:hypothetical protein